MNPFKTVIDEEKISNIKNEFRPSHGKYSVDRHDHPFIK